MVINIKKEIIKYGLKLKDKEDILQYSICQSTEDADCCVEIQHTLSECGEGDWLVDSKDKALYVMYNQTPYYNSMYGTPQHDYKPEQLELVSVKIITETKTIKTTSVKIKLKNNNFLINHYNSSKQKDTFYMANEIGIALDMGDYYQIVKMAGVQSNMDYDNKYSKEYFDEI